MNHTKGPWEVGEEDGSSIWQEGTYEIDKTTNLICNVYPIDIGKSGCQKYNARLIAAAPELYDALADLVGQCERDEPVICTGPALAALRKARGEA